MLERMGKKITKIGQDAIQKTQQIADISSFKSKIDDEKKTIAALYTQIGMHYYKTYVNSPHDDELVKICNALSEAELNITKYSEQIQIIKGVKRCSKCGAEIERNALFCSFCGSKVEVPVSSNSNVCEKCGTEYEEGARFCNNCGNRINDNN